MNMNLHMIRGMALSPGQQRAIALLLLAVVAALAATLLIRPFAALHAERTARIDTLERQTLQYRAAARNEALFAGQLERLRRDPRIASYHLQNTTPALAAAELQQHIQKMLEAHGCRLVSMQVVDAAPPPGLTTVTVRIRMRADISGLQNALFALESGHPLVTLDNVFLRVAGPGRGTATGMTEPLDVGFDASGYLLGRTS